MHSRLRIHLLACALASLTVLAPYLPSTLALPLSSAGPEAMASGGALLVENVGQFDARARFRLLASDATLWLAEDAIWITLLTPGAPDPATTREPVPEGGLHLRITFAGANPTPRLEPLNRLSTRASAFRGADPAGWHTDIPTWGAVRYVDLYPGVDLEIAPEGRGWTWRLVSRTAEGDALLAGAPGDASPRLHIEGAEGGEVVAGAVRLATAVGDVALPLLTVDWSSNGAMPALTARDAGVEIAYPFAGASLEGRALSAGLSAGGADLLYSTFLGGGGLDTGRDVALDAAGNAYVTGETWSTDMPVTPGAFDVTPSAPAVDSDAFVAKLAPDGRNLAYATFIGGAGNDSSYAIAVDDAGNAYITGETQSADFVTTPGAFDGAYSTVGWSDAFIVKLNASGDALGYATYLGGSDTDIGYGIGVDGSGSAYVAGYTGYADPTMADYEPFPTTAGALDETHNGAVGDTDAFVVKLHPSGSGLVYGTLFGASARDEAYDLALDAAGCAYVTGMTQSADLPVTAGAFATVHGGDDDAFVLKLAADGAAAEYAAFLGGDDSDWGYGIAVDSVGAAYVTGFTGSPAFPTTPGAFDVTHNGAYDAFVAKVSAGGDALAYSTFLGGSLADKGRAIAVDRYWCAYVAGETYSSDMAVVPGAFDTTANGQKDAFVAKLDTGGTGLAYGAYLGGVAEDVAHGIAVGEPGDAVIAGETGSLDYPVTAGAVDVGYNFGERDAVVSRLAMPGGAQPTTTPTWAPSPAPPTPATATATPQAGDGGDPTPSATPAPPSPTPTAPAGGYPGPSPTAAAPTPDPRLGERCYVPLLVRP